VDSMELVEIDLTEEYVRWITEASNLNGNLWFGLFCLLDSDLYLFGFVVFLGCSFFYSALRSSLMPRRVHGHYHSGRGREREGRKQEIHSGGIGELWFRVFGFLFWFRFRFYIGIGNGFSCRFFFFKIRLQFRSV
jgi:hypothetical protein